MATKTHPDADWKTLKISMPEACRNFRRVLEHVIAGGKAVIHDKEGNTVAVIVPPLPLPRIGHIDPPFRRTVSEALEIARHLERETGESPVMDADFVRDMEEIVTASPGPLQRRNNP